MTRTQEPSSYTIRDPEIEALMNRLAHTINDKLPTGWGFNLLLFEYGEKGALFYISSAQRDDMIRVMKEWIARNTH